MGVSNVGNCSFLSFFFLLQARLGVPEATLKPREGGSCSRGSDAQGGWMWGDSEGQGGPQETPRTHLVLTFPWVRGASLRWKGGGLAAGKQWAPRSAFWGHLQGT